MDRCNILEWEVVLGALVRVNVPSLMHDPCLYQINVKMTVDQHRITKL